MRTKKKRELVFTTDDVSTAFAVVAGLNPDHYSRSEVKALIWKIKSLGEDEMFRLVP